MTVRTYSDLLIYVYSICIIDLVFKLQIFAVLPLSHAGNRLAGGPAWSGWPALLLYKAPSPLSQPSSPSGAQKRHPSYSHEALLLALGLALACGAQTFVITQTMKGLRLRVAGGAASCRGAGPQRPEGIPKEDTM